MTEYPGHPAGMIPPSVLPAVVVSNADPDKVGCLQVRVPHYHGAQDNDDRVPDDKLPWVRPVFPFAGGGGGLFAVPQEGAAVAVLFYGGDYDTMFWIGGFVGDGDTPSEFSDGYENGEPKTYVLKTAGGHLIELREKSSDAQVLVQTASGHKVVLDDTNGQVSVESAGGNVIKIDDNENGIDIQAAGSVNVEAPQITIGPTGDDPVVVESKLLAIFNAHQHPSPAGGNTGTPVTPVVPTPGTPSVGSETVKASP